MYETLSQEKEGMSLTLFFIGLLESGSASNYL